MGLIVSTTPGNYLPNRTPIPGQKMKYADQVITGRGIPVTYYDSPEESVLSSVISELKVENVLPKDILHDYLWHVSYFLPEPCPSWSRYMSDISKGEHPGKSTISPLPIIDLNPAHMTCIYSILKFEQSQAKDLHIGTAITIFDQPLWIDSKSKIYGPGRYVGRISFTNEYPRKRWQSNERKWIGRCA